MQHLAPPGSNASLEGASRNGDLPPAPKHIQLPAFSKYFTVNALTTEPTEPTEPTESTEEDSRHLLFLVFSVVSVGSVVNAMDDGN
jgi:hypothetical protein